MASVNMLTKNFMEKLIWPVTIVVATLILGGFYYASQANTQASVAKQQQASLEAQQAQQQATLQAQQTQQQATIDRNNLIASQKAACVTLAAKTATSIYEESSLCTGAYAPKTCTDGQTYLMGNYNNEYDTCLQSKGLQ